MFFFLLLSIPLVCLALAIVYALCWQSQGIETCDLSQLEQVFLERLQKLDEADHHKDNQRFCIYVMGMSSSGKSTLCKQLSQMLHVPHLELDSLKHYPSWEQTSNEEMCQIVAKRLSSDEYRHGFIVDGNYKALTEQILAQKPIIIWLDYSRFVIFPRLFWRTFLRCLFKTQLWNSPECIETWTAQFFSSQSLFVFVSRTYHPLRARILELKNDYLGTIQSKGHFIHIQSPVDASSVVHRLNRLQSNEKKSL